MPGLPGLPPPGFSTAQSSAPIGLPGLPPPGFSGQSVDSLLGDGSDWAKRGRLAIGGLSQLIPFGLGDEITAGGSALLSALAGNNISDAYDQRLKETRDYQKAFNQRLDEGMDGPASAVFNIAGSALMPVPGGIFSKSPGIKAAAGNIAKGAGLGAALASATGFAGAEGGFDKRLESGENSALLGALAGGAISGIGEAGAKLANTAERWIPALGRRSIGARQSDYAKTANDHGILDLPEGSLASATRAAVDDFIKNNKLGPSRDPSKMLEIANAGENDLVYAIGKVIQDFDASGGKVKVAFDRALKYLEEGKVPADKFDAYLKRLGEIEAKINSEGGGRLSYTQQQKVAFGKMYDPADTALNGFNRAIYSDLQRTIEEAVPGIKFLNSELQKYKLVKPILTRQLVAEEAASPMGKLVDFVKTTGGVGVPLLLGASLDGSDGAIKGLMAGAAIKYGTSPAGLKGVASKLGQLEKLLSGSNAASALGSAGAIGALNAQGGESPTRSSSSLQELPMYSAGIKNQKPTPEALEGNKKTSPFQNSTPTPNLKPEILGQVKPGKGPNAFMDRALNRAEARLNGKPISDADVSPGKMEGASMSKISYEKPQVMDALVDAVIKQESNGKEKAVGPETKYGRAKGLMQLLDTTAKDVMKQMGMDPNDWEPFNGELNRKVGTHYLKQLLKKYDGDPELALAAYNFGMGRVDRLLKRVNGDSFEDIRSALPRETRGYRDNIIANLQTNHPGVIKV